jgi:hypothetical protein
MLLFLPERNVWWLGGRGEELVKKLPTNQTYRNRRARGSVIGNQ